MVSTSNPENLIENNDQNSPGHYIQVITFAAGKDIFGVDIHIVQEIIRSVQFTSVPNAPDFVEGVINLHGNIIPVIDLRKKLHLDSEEIHPEKVWIIILEVEGSITGFLVDKVLKAHKINPDELEKDADITGDILDRKYIRGIAHIDDKRIPLLDFNQIVRGDRMNKQ